MIVTLSLCLVFLILSVVVIYTIKNHYDYLDSPCASQAGGDHGGYCNMIVHILLLLFTFGIYGLVWISRITAYLNQVEDEPHRTPSNQLLLCIFVPFYYIYWTYKSAQRLDKLAASRGIASELTTLCLILAIFIGIIPPMIMQDKINEIATAKNGTATLQASVATPQLTIGTADELQKYKELLDNGAITDAEFNEKKRQLLNL